VSTPTIEVETLQKQLQERIEALDKQRKEESERFNKELIERAQLAEQERQARIEEYKEQSRKREEKKAKELAEEQERQKEETRKRIALETALGAAEEARKKQEEKLAWLQQEINKLEFVEEQHRKTMQQPTTPVITEENQVDVENPKAPVNPEAPADAVKETDGSTPDSNLMSTHLKRILRQATRSY
jgi:hypothetical protein